MVLNILQTYWLKKYVFIAVLNKKNINMDVFKHVFLEPWKIL